MSKDLAVTTEGHVAMIEIQRPPLNYFDLRLIRDIANTLDSTDADSDVRAVVLAAKGKAFCAGADFNMPSHDDSDEAQPRDGGHLYIEALRIFRSKKPIVASMARQSAAASA